MNNKIIYTFGGIVIMVIIIVFILIKQSSANIKLQKNTSNLNTRLKQCPDEWIDNQMPTVGSKKSETQYFILNGVRRELNEFDIEWVQKNCNLKKREVF